MQESPQIFTTAAVPGGTAALDVTVASSNAAAARGDAAQCCLCANNVPLSQGNPRPASARSCLPPVIVDS